MQVGTWVAALWILDRLDGLDALIASRDSLLDRARARRPTSAARRQAIAMNHLIVWLCGADSVIRLVGELATTEPSGQDGSRTRSGFPATGFAQQTVPC